MEPGEVIGMIVMVVGILIFSAIVMEGYKRRLTSKERTAEIEVRRLEALAAVGTARGGDVEERLRVLERIATDASPSLARQIEALREPAPAPAPLRTAEDAL